MYSCWKWKHYLEEASKLFLEGIDWASIGAGWLEEPFEEEEMRGRIWDLGKDKASRPDGFTKEFFKRCWDIVKMDLLKVFEEFYLKATISKSMNSTFYYPNSQEGQI